MKSIEKLLIALLKCEITNEKLPEGLKGGIDADVLGQLLALSSKHDLAHIAASALRANGLLGDDEVSKSFGDTEFSAVLRLERMKFEYAKICETLSNAEIPFIPLKGSVLRPFYPKENMRTSCDIDILVKEDTLKNAISALVDAGYTYVERTYNYHDVSLFSKSGVHLELHFNILENTENLDRVLINAWDYAIPSDGYRYSFTDEFFVFQIFAHIYYHFIAGGCGLRSLIDIWVMKNKMGLSYKVGERLLKEVGAYKFSAEMSRIAELCFSDGVFEPMDESIISYIAYGGTYGVLANKQAVKKTKTKSQFLYMMKRWLLPYKIMKRVYPILNKLPFLLPVFWVVRLFRLLNAKQSNKVLREIKLNSSLPQEYMDSVESIVKYLEI